MNNDIDETVQDMLAAVDLHTKTAEVRLPGVLGALIDGLYTASIAAIYEQLASLGVAVYPAPHEVDEYLR